MKNGRIKNHPSTEFLIMLALMGGVAILQLLSLRVL